jgi:hypothetical protein
MSFLILLFWAYFCPVLIVAIFNRIVGDVELEMFWLGFVPGLNWVLSMVLVIGGAWMIFVYLISKIAGVKI